MVTGSPEDPHAVLIRAVEPISGLETMLSRRTMKTLKPQLTAGPGVLSKALAMSRQHNGVNLLDKCSPVQLRVTGPEPAASEIVAVPRIGMNYAGSSWVEKPWRFYLRNCSFVSKLA